MEFQIRQLNYSDMAPLTKIISKIGVAKFAPLFKPETVKGLMGDEEDREAQIEKVGTVLIFEILAIVLENFENASDDLAAWLGSVAGMTAAEVKALPLPDVLDLFQAVFSAPEFADFFTRASRFAGAKGGASGRADSTPIITIPSPS